jgi:ketosteroid isomerase-like protein
VTASPNLDLVRSICAAWERGDYTSAEWAHPEIEFTRPDGTAPGTWTGLAGMAQGMGEILSAWEGLRAEAEECRELDDERVLVFLRMGGRGKTSRLDLGDMLTKAATLFHIRDGKVTRLDVYADRANALADLGLAPEGGSE